MHISAFHDLNIDIYVFTKYIFFKAIEKLFLWKRTLPLYLSGVVSFYLGMDK